jgi:hypothetical protein
VGDGIVLIATISERWRSTYSEPTLEIANGALRSLKIIRREDEKKSF